MVGRGEGEVGVGEVFCLRPSLLATFQAFSLLLAYLSYCKLCTIMSTYRLVCSPGYAQKPKSRDKEVV